MLSMTACATSDGVRTPSMAGDAAGALLRPVHAAGVELDDAVGVRQPAVADAVSSGIELDDVDACDRARREHPSPPRHQAEGLLDAGLGAAVLVEIAVGGGDDDRLGAFGRDHRGTRLRRECLPGAHGPCKAGGGRFHELTTVDTLRHEGSLFRGGLYLFCLKITPARS